MSVYLIILIIFFLFLLLSLIFDTHSGKFLCSLIFCSSTVSFCLSWLHPLSLVIAVYGSGKESSADGLCFWLLQSDLSILCKYLYRGIIDGHTHSRWGCTLLQATLGQGMVLSGAWTRNERRWCNVIQHDRRQWWLSELLQVLILPPLFSSVFSKQAPSSDLPLKHADTMVSVLYFRDFWVKGMLMVDCIFPVSNSSIHLKLIERSNSSSILK